MTVPSRSATLNRVRVYGLTGGIGSGKSTVARLLAEAGAAVIDADEVAREVVRPGTDGLRRVAESFGNDILDEQGALDRKKLAGRVFADDAARRTLNGIVHPLIAQATMTRMGRLAAQGVAVAVNEAALLVENGAYKAFDGLLVVVASPELRASRVVLRDGVQLEDVRRRMAAQTTDARRRAAASLVIVNDGSFEELRDRVRALYPRLVTGDVPPPDSGG